MEWIKKLLTPSPEKLLKPLYKQADAIDALEPTYEKLTDDQLREKTNELRARAQGGEELDKLLAQVKAMGIQQAIDAYQSAYSRYLAR